ncbi:hypothetical protein AB0K21_21585 [Streptosporangium sp. NPDC049248]|uniref:hypothetical protein n=1 Tax=Streptosporangium sp. NPDC049248 TaxID=3155651 RepID=UPI003446B6D5
MPENSTSAFTSVPQEVIDAIDAITTERGWPRQRREPCVGHMVSEHRPVDGIDVSINTTHVEIRVAGLLVGIGKRWGAIGNAYIRCLLPHAPFEDAYASALHQGGAINDFQHHLLTTHGTHGYDCSRLMRRERWCRICQAS